MNENEILNQEENIDENTQVEGTPTETDEQPKAFELKVKYNHEELTLDEERAVELAQKGLNYDKLAKQRDELLIKAKDLGFNSTDEMLQAFEQNKREKEIEELADKKDISHEEAKLEIEFKYLKKKQAIYDFAIEKGIAISSIPQEVIDGYTLKDIPLTLGYSEYEKSQKLSVIEQEYEKLKVELANLKNSVAAPESAKGTDKKQESEFYTKEQLDTLTKEQIAENPDKAYKSMLYWSKK